MLEEDFTKKYQDFRESLPSLDSGKYAELYTESQKSPFRVYKNSKGITVKPFTEDANAMTISLNQLIRVQFDNEEYNLASYEPVILKRIINDDFITEEEIKDETEKSYIEKDTLSVSNEKKFRIFLDEKKKTNGEIYSESTKNNFINRLKNLKKNIFSISNPSSILKIINSIKNKEMDYDQRYSTTTALDYYLEFLEASIKENKQYMNIKNIILYGSPGVGKTHNTNKLINLIESGVSEKEIFKSIKENKKETIDLDEDLKVRTKFITFHQSFGYEDFIEGFRPNEEGQIQLANGIFKEVSLEAQKNLDNSKLDIQKEVIDIESLFDKYINYVQDSLDKDEKYFLHDKITIESIADNKSLLLGGSIKSNTQRVAFDMVKRDYESFKNGAIKHYEDIKPKYESQRTFHGNARYYYFLYEKLLEYEKSIDSHSIELKQEPLKNYYLVIDEINRGNISKIFGELITLIEEDKRDKLEVLLPYSKEAFKIPSNLYIIGTMNSTDKSIALIDIALRRRFTFLKMKPNADLIEYFEAKELFIRLNEYISKSHLGEDYQIGHSYFMGINSDDDLEFVWEYKVKPLLEEYFYGDANSLGEILKLK